MSERPISDDAAQIARALKSKKPDVRASAVSKANKLTALFPGLGAAVLRVAGGVKGYSLDDRGKLVPADTCIPATQLPSTTSKTISSLFAQDAERIAAEYGAPKVVTNSDSTLVIVSHGSPVRPEKISKSWRTASNPATRVNLLMRSAAIVEGVVSVQRHGGDIDASLTARDAQSEVLQDRLLVPPERGDARWQQADVTPAVSYDLMHLPNSTTNPEAMLRSRWLASQAVELGVAVREICPDGSQTKAAPYRRELTLTHDTYFAIAHEEAEFLADGEVLNGCPIALTDLAYDYARQYDMEARANGASDRINPVITQFVVAQSLSPLEAAA